MNFKVLRLIAYLPRRYQELSLEGSFRALFHERTKKFQESRTVSRTIIDITCTFSTIHPVNEQKSGLVRFTIKTLKLIEI